VRDLIALGHLRVAGRLGQLRVLELLSAWYDRLDAELEAVPLPPARSTVDVDTNGRT